jgi:hypothetical protein
MKPKRIKISYEDAIYYYHGITGTKRLKKISTLYDKMGFGRICYGIPTRLLKPEHLSVFRDCQDIRDSGAVVFVCDKEVYPPVFRIGEF